MFPVVGIGASAGGLDALKEFFAAMAPESGMAFVVVQHLEPSSESRMADILGRYTGMTVVQAAEAAAVQPNAVYTNPPGRDLILRHGRFVLGEPTKRGHAEGAIDCFLTSLAEDQGSKCVGIVLSGSSGADGPRGVRAIRAAGGMIMAQEPSTAQFTALPQAAIDTGLVDYVLSPGQMPAALLEFVHHPQILAAGRGETPDSASISELEAILNLLHVRNNCDYRRYKRNTLYRRIQRRMGLRQVATMGDYLKLLQKDKDELTNLGRDMLIGVSSFFRDIEAFAALQSDAIAPLVQSKGDDEPLRAWVPGCATGEEAYSIAMLMLEARSAAGKPGPIQVFATDIDEEALETARTGTYPLSIAKDIPANRLQRFFAKHGQTYQVDKHLREMVVFSRHNLLSDPPFSKVDLISCRNVLIYVEPAAQSKVLSVFSFALNAGGYLLLGKSEGVGRMADLFEPVSKECRLYRLTRANRQAAGEFPLYAAGRTWKPVGIERPEAPASALPQANLEAILQHFKASAVLIDPEGKILYFHGQTERYLGHPKGLASLNVFDMTGGTLSAKLRRAVDKVLKDDKPVVLAQVPLPRGRSAPANLTVTSVRQRVGGTILAIIFEDATEERPPGASKPVAAEDESLVAQLEAEVKSLRAEVRTNAEGYDAATEELKAANEEMMSMNEELQSSNEELEASKEELQSLNEETTTINAQLNDKVFELTAVNNDLANLMGATEVATVFLDGDLKIRRFTPHATGLLNLIDSDIGRPVSHITQNFTGVDLAADAASVIKSLAPLEKELQTRDGHWYTLRILPYRTLDDRIDGVVVTFSDVDRLKAIEAAVRNEKEYADNILATVRHPLLSIDNNLRVLSANAAFYELFRVTPDESIGRSIFDLGNGQWDIPQLRALLEDVIPRESAFHDYRVEHDFQQIGHRVMLVSGRRIQPTANMPERLLVTLEDVTESERDRGELRALNDDLERRVASRTSLAEHRSGQLRQLASELASTEQRERERLARLLHDDLQQLLVATKFQLGIVRSVAADERSLEAVKLMDSLLDKSLNASKSLTVELSPSILFEDGLDAAIPWLARQMEAQDGLKVQTEINAVVKHDDQGVAILLFQAVRELLLNVVKHANTDSARVQLDRVDGNEVRIVVSDEGDGFDTTKLVSSANGSTGLGLFGMQERMKYVGGRCEIESTPGHGTRVTLVADVGRPQKKAKAAPPALSPETPSAAVAEAKRASAGKIRVLLVDDHAIVRHGLKTILNAEPDIVVVGEAGSGRGAIEQARIHRPDVIVMDVSMPEMNGMDATRAIVAEWPDARIIGLSMYQETDRAEAMVDAGAAGYVSKGGPSEDLLAAIRTAAKAP